MFKLSIFDRKSKIFCFYFSGLWKFLLLISVLTISKTNSIKILYANDKFLATKSNYFNHTYPSLKVYGRNQKFFNEPGTQNYSKGMEQTQNYNLKILRLVKISEHASSEPKSSSTKDIISRKAETNLENEDFIDKNIPVSFSLKPLEKKGYENDLEKKTKIFKKIIPNANISKVELPLQIENWESLKLLPWIKYNEVKSNNFKQQSNAIKTDKWKTSANDFFSSELSPSFPLKNLTRFNRQSQQQSSTTNTTSAATTATTTATTSATTIATTTATTTSAITATTTATTTSAITATTTATTTSAITATTSRSTTFPTTAAITTSRLNSATTTRTTTTTTPFSTRTRLNSATTRTTTTTRARPNSCFTQTCDQTITGRQLSYTR